MMEKASNRIDARQAHERVESGNALLICAYDSEEKFRANRLEGAMSLNEFRSRADSLPKDRELIFYCA